MALNNLPIVLEGFRLLVTEPVQVKTREVNGVVTPVVNRDGEEQYVVVLFAKPRPRADGRKARGEEIRVSLPYEPAEHYEEGTYVELVNPMVSYYEIEDRESGRKSSGLSFKAETLAPAMPVARAA